MADKEEYITETSSFLTETARRVESILQKLKWKKETLLKEVFKNQQIREITLIMRTKVPTTAMFYLCNLSLKANKSKIVHCPVNPSHRISTSRFEKHLSVCQYTSKGLKPQVKY